MLGEIQVENDLPRERFVAFEQRNGKRLASSFQADLRLRGSRRQAEDFWTDDRMIPFSKKPDHIADRQFAMATRSANCLYQALIAPALQRRFADANRSCHLFRRQQFFHEAA